jgi:hypothetical protein
MVMMVMMMCEILDGRFLLEAVQIPSTRLMPRSGTMSKALRRPEGMRSGFSAPVRHLQTTHDRRRHRIRQRYILKGERQP